METQSKACVNCGKVIRGRADKKFCDDYCRNNYNNQLKADDVNFVRNVNNALRKNRRVLQNMLPGDEEMAKTTKTKMLAQGFSFLYHTHSYTNKKGNIYFFCYEFGYLPLEQDWVLVVKRKQES